MAAAGIGIAAVSVDEPGRAEEVRRRYGLPFPLLCDPEAQLVRAWGLFDPAEKGGIARPATFVLDAGLTVRFRSLDGVVTRVRAADLAHALASRPGGGPRGWAPFAGDRPDDRGDAPDGRARAQALRRAAPAPLTLNRPGFPGELVT